MRDIKATIDKALLAAGLSRQTRGRERSASAASTFTSDTVVEGVGQFSTCTHTSAFGPRAYKLFVPSGYEGRPMPLIVMLHGCKQNPGDFAAGTRMNELADERGFIVAYPEQSARANGANCWNWFEPAQQRGDGREPSDVVGIVRDLCDRYAIDAAQVYVAGLSAGASMAVVLGATHPDVFAGVGAHSGLPLGAARDVTSAFAAMGGSALQQRAAAEVPALPTIVIHGTADHTVASSNGAAIVKAAVLAHARESATLQQVEDVEESCGGKRCHIARYVDAAGRCRVEQWSVEGGAHTWFGGSSEGSYTDRAGPNASEAMVRFFLDDEMIVLRS